MLNVSAKDFREIDSSPASSIESVPRSNSKHVHWADEYEDEIDVSVNINLVPYTDPKTVCLRSVLKRT